LIFLSEDFFPKKSSLKKNPRQNRQARLLARFFWRDLFWRDFFGEDFISKIFLVRIFFQKNLTSKKILAKLGWLAL